LKVAIIHYWLVNMRGGEKVVEALCELFPQADIFTHVYAPEKISSIINRHNIKTTFIQKLPAAREKYQAYLPLMPLALEKLDLRSYDLVISSESGPSKGVITRPDTLHICYCHTPMRYLWDMYQDYLESTKGITKLLMPYLSHYLRVWDFSSAARVDHFIANSEFVSLRIRKFYRREAQVIHPPVATGEFSFSDQKEDFYLVVGQLVTYKKADLAVEAFNRLGKRLIIIGEGAQRSVLEKLAKANITIMGRQPFKVIADHYKRCKALIFPGVEDFGIVPVEAMASGTPVIAFKKGGVLETVIDGKTGIFFNEQTPDSLINAVIRFESIESFFNNHEIATHSKHFDKKVFKDKFSIMTRGLLKNS
jgi:glycosyltransferase involved in cell wall biosynthesis